MNYYKKLLFGFITLLILYAAVELVAFAAFFAAEGKPFSFASMRIAMTEAIGATKGDDPDNLNMPGEVVAHPYWGYVTDWESLVQGKSAVDSSERVPRKEGLEHDREQSILLNGPDYELPTRTPEVVNVAVFGGSVAIQIARGGLLPLIAELQKFDEYRGRKIRVYDAAQAALKEPQQLTKLSYLSALGSEFDIIINIDGLNEVYQSEKNFQLGVFPFYPAFWHKLVEKVGSSASIRLVAETTFLRDRRSSLARIVADSPLQYSVTGSTMWFLFDQWLQSQISQRLVQLEDQETSGTYVTNGPRFPLDGQASLPQEIADTWMRSSLGLKALAEAFGAKYFHFLQPNQYLPDSKPMGAAERKKAILPESGLNQLVPEIYPLLIDGGNQLRLAGVNFYDLTLIFKDQQEARYKDTCCHFNRTGVRELARQIGQSIVQQLKAQDAGETDAGGLRLPDEREVDSGRN